MAMLLSIVACSDDSGNNYSGNNGPNKKEGPLTIEDVKGLWTYDIDGDNDQNLGTTLFDFNHEKATIRSTIIDFEDIKLIDATEQITWKVIPDFLSEPNVYGHREVLSLNYGEEEVNLYVKSFSKDCLELYLLESVEDNTIEAPLKLVRQDEENNKAQLIDMSEEEISSLVGEMVSTENEPLDTDSEDNTNWMGRIDGKRLVCDLSIPGTHDSTTDNVNLLVQFGAKTQAFDVGKQWDKGCRAFDFRVRNYEDDVEMCHGPIPNNYSFRKSFTTVLDRVLRDKTEFGTIFINTEGQPMDDWVQKVFGESSVSVLSGILTTGLVVVHANQLDEELTRIRVFNIIREELRKRNAEDKICYYRPDLTLDEARGKLIIINRVPADYNRTQWDFVGQALIKNKLTIIADDPNKCPDI
ncbi:MAG: hypothetical protein Q4F34_07925, partial [Prevotellaceae bacterium]|nr:hypothetical protein [Prevotellaceae bacterium]